MPTSKASISPERKMSPVSARRLAPSACEAKTRMPVSPAKPKTRTMKVTVRLAPSAASSAVP